MINNAKIFEIKPILKEKVRLSISGSKRVIDNEKGAWYEVIWFNSGEFELHPLQPVNSSVYSPGNIPFSPIRSKQQIEEYGWGDRR